MTRDDQLQWEARWAVPAAIASFGAALLLVVSATAFFPKDRKGIGRAPDLLLSIHDQSGAYLTSAVLTALAALLLLAVFYYLFRAVVARGGGVPRWFVYLVYAAPILFAIGSVVYAFQATDIADEFASGTPDPRPGGRGPRKGPQRHQPGADRSPDGRDGGRGVPVRDAPAARPASRAAHALHGHPRGDRRRAHRVPARGRRPRSCRASGSARSASSSSAAGRAGAGRPGSRGEAEPWPSARQRHAQLRGDPPPAEPSPDAAPGTADPEPVPDRPPSRKRRKKRR